MQTDEDPTPEEAIMKMPKAAAKAHRIPKAKTRSLRVRTKVRAGRITANRCDALRLTNVTLNSKLLTKCPGTVAGVLPG